MFIIDRVFFTVKINNKKIYFNNKQAATAISKDTVNREELYIKVYDTIQEYKDDNKTFYEIACKKLSDEEYEAIVKEIRSK